MKVIADTNIVISALISRKGKESDIILNPVYDFKKYTCNFKTPFVKILRAPFIKGEFSLLPFIKGGREGF